MLALEHGNLDDIVTVSHEALQDLNAAGSSPVCSRASSCLCASCCTA